MMIKLAGLMTALLLVACGQGFIAEPSELEASTHAIESMNGPELTGVSNFGTLSNTADMYLSGDKLICSGGSCKGAERSFGGPRVVKIFDLSADNRYLVKYRISGDWKPLCTSNTGPWAIPVSGYWGNFARRVNDSSSFTFVCTDSAAYHCKVGLGYDPNTDIYQACTRMLRADYCGMGDSYTREGERIDVTDSGDSPGYGVLEAAWGVNGAICIDAYRFESSDLFCKDRISRVDCSSISWGGSPAVLLKSRVHPFSERGGLCGSCAPGLDCHCRDHCRALTESCP